jgi:hypothetical protein
MNLNVRIEFSNIFHRVEEANPTATNAKQTQVSGVSGFGAVNNVNVTTFAPPGQGTLVMRFTF